MVLPKDFLRVRMLKLPTCNVVANIPRLMTGPSTNFYVGPQHKHYTIPKRLIYHFSDHARVCLEGNFAEAAANAIWLPDVNPDVFQLLWRWLYTGQLDINSYCSMDDNWWELSKDQQRQQVCQLLCRVQILGERLLFHRVFLEGEVQQELETLIEQIEPSPYTAEITQEVLSSSAPVQYRGYWGYFSLRPVVLGHWLSFDICTTTDFYEYIGCFEQDGAFAAEVMTYMASEIMWAVKRWEKQTETIVDVNEKKQQLAEEDGLSHCVVRRYGRPHGVWLVCRYMCTFTGCTTTNFRRYSECFELDGAFAAEIMEYMAEELLWVVDCWGIELGSWVDYAAEKVEEEQEESRQRLVDKIIRRGGWT